MKSLECEWVIGRYKGERAKSVLAHSDHGISYIILDSSTGRGVALEVLAAHRRACDSPVPQHLEKVTDQNKIAKYEKIRKERAGLKNHETNKSAGARLV